MKRFPEKIGAKRCGCLFLVTVALVAGCRKQEIRVYRVPKEKEPELAEAQENQERARRELDAESQRVLSEVQQQYVRAKTSEERLKIYSDGLVPQSEATFRSSLSAYQSNRQDFESLLSSFLDVLNLDLEYRSELVEHESALAELERLAGVTLP